MSKIIGGPDYPAWTSPEDPIPPVFSSVFTAWNARRQIHEVFHYDQKGQMIYERDVHSCDYYDNIICKEKCSNCKNRTEACFQELPNGRLESLHSPCQPDRRNE